MLVLIPRLSSNCRYFTALCPEELGPEGQMVLPDDKTQVQTVLKKKIIMYVTFPEFSILCALAAAFVPDVTFAMSRRNKKISMRALSAQSWASWQPWSWPSSDACLQAMPRFTLLLEEGQHLLSCRPGPAG